MRLLTPVRARAGRRALPAGFAVLAAIGGVATPAGAAPAAPSGGRAYELVSTADTGGLDVAGRVGGQAVVAGHGAGGGAALLATIGTPPGGQAGDLGFAPIRAHRTADGWVGDPLAPPLTPGVPRPTGLPNGSVAGWSPDLSSVLISTNQPMVAGVDTTVQNVFRRAFAGGAGGAASILAAPASQLAFSQPLVTGVSADGRTVLFQTPDQLTPDAPSVFTANLYRARDGQVELVSRREDGTPLPNGLSFDAPLPGQHVLSDDGRTAVAISGSDSEIYVTRDGAIARASAPQGGTDGTPRFWGATSDGGAVLFTDNAPLTPDSSPTGGDAYRYDVATGALTVLAPSTVTGVNPPQMRFVGASDDGDTVYFAAFANLTADTPAGGGRPIYRWHAGTLSYVGRTDTSALATIASFSSVTPDGRFLVYPSSIANTAQSTGATAQLYRYDAATGTTACASCPADGSPATAAIQPYGVGYGIFAAFSFALPNRVSADGRHVAFTTTAALSPRDVNEQADVYEWTPDGLGLISSGTDPSGALLGDLSADGTDVYFTTRDRLVGRDADDDVDLYDARLGGGFPEPAPADDAGSCAGDACQGAPSPARPVPAAATVTFSGPGDATADATVPQAPAGVKATRGAVRAGRLTVTVRVPGAGRITASGPRLRTVRRTATKAGTYRLTVALTAQARRTLKRHKKVKVSVKVGFTPAGEKPSNATLSLTVKA